MDIDRISRKPEGDLQDESRTTRERIGTVDTGAGTLEILLERMDRHGQIPIWLFSSETLLLIPAAAAEVGSFSLELYLPRTLVDIRILSISLYFWVVGIIGLALALGLGTLVTRALVPLLRPLLRRMTGEEDDRALRSIKAPLRLILVSVAFRLFSTFSSSLVMRQFWTRVAITIGIIGLAWLVIKFSDGVSELYIMSLRRRGRPGKIAMWTLVRRLFRATVVAVTGLVFLHRAGGDLTAILTGLGIGGLAIALAAQKTLENLLGGVMIITDEPMRVGDFCRVADQTGTIEDIGLRSTRIRTLSRTVVAIPNGQLAVANVENFSLRDKFWFRHLIGVRYETTADQLRYLLAGIRAMLYSHPKVERDGARIRFVGFGGSSLDLEIFAYVSATEMPVFLGIQEDLLLRIMDIIAEAGTGIAFPSQTTYLAKDAPLDSQKTEEAVTKVREWRERGDLPFPDFRPDQVGNLGDPVEYPPPGSSLRTDRGDLQGKAPKSDR
ncbi:MAG: mechanosensitive ion channel family protein [Deltaproteobacteria bacterium]|nr:mechanosensitive ion channel family protein [Deltaproteobacteria bacterium]